MFLKTKEKNITVFGDGYNIVQKRGERAVKSVSIPDSYRKGHFWCFGTTRVGKTRALENMAEQDIRKGYSVVIIDPKGDIELFSKITQLAFETGREKDLMLITPIFPEYSINVNPLSKYYMPEELVSHITAGVAVGKEPYFFNVAYEVSLVIVNALIMLAQQEGIKPNFNLSDIKKFISHDDLEQLKEKVDMLDTADAESLAFDIEKIIKTPADYYSKVASSLRVALTELISGNIGIVIGKADENRFIEKIENNESIILVAQLGSLLTRRAAHTVGKVIISMIQSFVGRQFSSGKTITPPLSIHIDEAQSVLYTGIEELFSKAGGAGVYIHGYCQSISQLIAEIGKDRANTILDNCNTKLFMRVPDFQTAKYISQHLGEKKIYSPLMSLGGGITIRSMQEERIRPEELLSLQLREFFFTTYSGMYRGKTKKISQPWLNVKFPEI